MQITVFSLFCFVPALIAADKAYTYQELVNANKHFTPLLFKEIDKKIDGNFLASPTSLEVVLALTESGAKDETSKELLEVLGLPDNRTAVHYHYKDLLEAIKSGRPGFNLLTANKLFVKQSLHPKDLFRSIAQDFFSSNIKKTDFSKTGEAVDEINKFVAKETEGKIKDLVNPDMITPDTSMVLVNTLYLKTKFRNQFGKNDTRQETFHVSKSKTVQADLMNQLSLFRIRALPDLKAKLVQIPFKNRDSNLIVVVPDEIDGLDKVEENLDKILDVHFNHTEGKFLDLFLPKFKFETTLQLKPMLQNLGMKKVFSQADADLSGIAGKKGDLWVSDVVQKTAIDVNEYGVEAAAASAANIMNRIMLVPPSDPEVLKIDRPFIYFIRVKGVVLFIGRVLDPTS